MQSDINKGYKITQDPSLRSVAGGVFSLKCGISPPFDQLPIADAELDTLEPEI